MTPEELESRSAEVLAAMKWLGHDHGGHSPDVVARCLSLYRRRDCPWCPLGPPPRRQAARAVPAASRELVRHLLVGLQAAGQLAAYRDPGNKLLWVLAANLRRADENPSKGRAFPQAACAEASATAPRTRRPGTRAARPGWSYTAPGGARRPG